VPRAKALRWPLVHRSQRCAITILLAGACVAIMHLRAAADAGGEIEALAFEAAGAPAEFAADLLIRIAGSPEIADAARRRELLETAFMQAYGAQQPYKRDAPTAPFESEAGSIARAYASGLNTLTLQLRVVAGLVPIDPARARQLFEWIDFSLPSASCASLLVPVADEYFSTLATVARRTFGRSVEERGDAIRFFQLYAWRIHLPSEVPPVLRAARTLGLSRTEAGAFDTTLSAMLEHLEIDPRGFSSYGLEIVRLMSELATDDRLAGVGGEILLRATRQLVAAQLSAARCSDSIAEGSIAETFNAIVRREEFTPDVVAPLTNADMWPVRMLGAVPPERYWRSFDARQLLAALLQLRDAAAGRQAAAVKRTPEWQAAAREFLTDLERWDGSHDQLEREEFDEKSILFDVYLDMAPPGELNTRAVRSFVDFLQHSDNGRLPRAAWFSSLRRLLDHGSPATLPAMEQSGHPLLTLYARAERLLNRNRTSRTRVRR
jgi:hypothetical protein